MKQGEEAMQGLHAKELTRMEFAKLAPQIREHMKFNAFDSERSKTGSWHNDRTETVRDLRTDMRRPVAHEHIYVAYDSEERVVGFLAVHTHATGTVADGQELWTRFPGKRQRGIAHTLITQAKENLEHHGIHHLVVEAPSPSREMRLLKETPEFRKFLKIRRGDGMEEEIEEEEATPDIGSDVIPQPEPEEEPEEGIKEAV